MQRSASNRPFLTRVREFCQFALGPRPEERPTSGRTKIALIKQGLFSYSNLRTAEQLAEHFPEYELEIIDIRRDILRWNKGPALRNFLSVFYWFGWDILLRRRTVRKSYYRTPFLFHTLRRLLAERFRGRESEYAFTISTQSLFDASVPGIPHFVYTDHTHLTNLYYPAFDRSRLLPRQIIDLERLIYTRATRVFVMGNHVSRSLFEFYGIAPEKVVCVYGGSNVDPEPIPLENDGYRNQHIVFVGIEWARKGGPLLMEVLHKVRKRFPNATLSIVGCRPEVNEDGVEVLGKVERAEVKRQLAKASVMVFPTQIEPFGIAPIEAFLHKIPVVASRIGAVPDIVAEGESGYLVDPSDSDGFATAIMRLFANPEKAQQFGERGYELVQNKFTWAGTGARIREGVLIALEERERLHAENG